MKNKTMFTFSIFVAIIVILLGVILWQKPAAPAGAVSVEEPTASAVADSKVEETTKTETILMTTV